MAVITFDVEKNTISILVEKTDVVNYKEDNIIETGSGAKYIVGKVFANGEVNICMVRGER